MVDFSKVAKQLREEPIQTGADGVRRVIGIGKEKNDKTGQRGHAFEGRVAKLLNHFGAKTGSDYESVQNKVHNVVGSKATRKADILDEKGNGYSVKTKMNNDQGMKIQQSSHPGSLYSKLGVETRKRPLESMSASNIKAILNSNPLAQSLIMMFGNKNVSPERMGNMMKDSFNDEQMSALQQIGDDSKSFMKANQLEELFPDQYKELMQHLDDNKFKIFNGLVRQKGGMPGTEDIDTNPVNRFISHITDEGISGANRGTDEDPDYDFTGSLAMHDMSDEAVRNAMEQLNWFHDENRFYLAENETDVMNDRVLDLFSYDEENTGWTMFPGDNNPMKDDRGRKTGVIPGAFKAMMSANPEVLERLFPKLLSGKINGNTFNLDKIAQEPVSTPQQPQYADGTPKNKIPDKIEPDQGQKFGNFIKKAGSAIKNRVNDIAQITKQIDDKKNNVEPFKPSPIPNIPKQMDSGNLGRLNDEQRSELEDAMRWIRDGKIDSPEEEKAAKRLVGIYNGEMPLDKYDPDLLNRALKMFYGD